MGFFGFPSTSCGPPQAVKEFKDFNVAICKTDRYMNSSIINQDSNVIQPVNLFKSAFAISDERTDLTHLDFTVHHTNCRAILLLLLLLYCDFFPPKFFYKRNCVIQSELVQDIHDNFKMANRI